MCHQQQYSGCCHPHQHPISHGHPMPFLRGFDYTIEEGKGEIAVKIKSDDPKKLEALKKVLDAMEAKRSLCGCE